MLGRDKYSISCGFYVWLCGFLMEQYKQLLLNVNIGDSLKIKINWQTCNRIKYNNLHALILGFRETMSVFICYFVKHRKRIKALIIFLCMQRRCREEDRERWL